MYTRDKAIEVFDHDWKSLAEGVAIPHGLYDLKLNTGYIHISTSDDTCEFACDAIRAWCKQYGSVHYAPASSILLLCGGSNRSRQYLFKQDLQAVANEIEIRIAHYPPYTSKYNPIEHRLFPHLSRVCQGAIFQSVEMVRELMAKAKRQTGLEVFATILNKAYETGRTVTQEFKQTMQITLDEYLPP